MKNDELLEVSEKLKKYASMLEQGVIIGEKEQGNLNDLLAIVTMGGESLISKYIPSFFYENKQGAEVLINFNPNFLNLLSTKLKRDSDLFFKSLNNEKFNFLTISFYGALEEILKEGENVNKVLDMFCSSEVFLKLKSKSPLRTNAIIKSLYTQMTDEQKLNKDLAKKVLSLNANVYEDFPDLIKKDIELINMALEAEPMNLRYMPASIKSNKALVSRCIDKAPQSLGCAISELRANRELVMKAVRLDPKCINLSHGKIKDRKLLFKILLSRCIKEDESQVFEMMEHMSQKFRSDAQIILQGAAVDQRVLYLMSEALRTKVKKVAIEIFNASDFNKEQMLESLKMLAVYQTSIKERQSLTKNLPKVTTPKSSNNSPGLSSRKFL